MVFTSIDPSLTPTAAMGYQNIPNILPNGGFEVWQRGAGPFTGSTPLGQAYTADRWSTYFSSSSYSLSVSKETTTIDTSGTASMKVVSTLISPDFAAMVTRIEAPQNYRGKTISLSIRCNTNVAGNMCNANISCSPSGNSATSVSHTGNGTWQTLTATVAVGAADTSIAIFLNVAVGSFVGTSYWDNAMLVIGSTPVAFVPTDPEVELARCQRYFWRVGQANGVALVGTVYGLGHATSSTSAYGYLYPPVTMRVAPTVTFVSPTLMQLHNAAGGNISTTAVISSYQAPGVVVWTATVSSGLVAGNVTALETQNASAAPIDISADL